MLKLDEQGFLTHPYLLSPTSDGMTIVWETANPVPARVIVKGGGESRELSPQAEPGTPWQYFSDGTSFSRLRINQLQSETEYQYSVNLDNGISASGSFKTLASNPKKVRFLFLSDTHDFKIGAQMCERILMEKPDFVVHGGDLLVGSSLQKDQYQLWFKPMREALSSIPFLYMKGNHDEGPYFDDYFTQGQRDIYPSDPLTGNNISIHYGPMHLLLGNSNPWSLMEANVESAGLELDVYWRSVIASSQKWIDQTLSSQEVQQKPWRICGFHHHYLDACSRKYVVPMMEKNNVELTLMGHVHGYQHTISASGDNHYVAIGDSINATSEVSYSHPSQLLMDNVPELLALGQCDFAIITASEQELQLDLHTVLRTKPITSQIWQKDAAPITVSKITLSSYDCNAGEIIKLDAKLKNTATFAQPAIIKAQLNGKQFPLNKFTHDDEKSVVQLDAGESQQLSCELIFAEPGLHQLVINEQIFNIQIMHAPASFVLKQPRIKTGKGIDSNLIQLNTVVENTGDVSGNFTLNMEINGEVVCKQQLTLDGKSQQDVELQYRMDIGGLYQVGVNDQWVDEVEIQHGLTILPLVSDCTGNGHNAILHGQPILEEIDGVISLHLDGKDDYVEIPAHPEISPDKAYATQVVAKINSLEGYNRFDHFALFSKGPSLGYGPTYMMRLAIRDTGCLTSGISFNIDEYFWDGGEVKIGEWANYTVSFDKLQGGNTWIDQTCVASIAGVGEQAVIRNWPDYPIFIGLAYLGYVKKDLGRAKYYSLMRANLQRFRFYDRAIDSTELGGISKYSTTDHNLIVDLDFSQINTQGSYVSPWLKGFSAPRIEVDIKLPQLSTAYLRIETETEQQDIILTDGNNVIEFTKGITGEALRFIIKLQGDMQPGVTNLPIVRMLTLYGIDKKMTWNTAADWYHGKLTGALGFENIHRLREYPDDGSW